MTDGAAHQEWIKFYEEKYGIEPIKIITRLYSDGTAKRNLNSDEIHVFRVCLAIGGRQFTFQNFKSVSLDVAFSPRFSIWHQNTQVDKKSLTAQELKAVNAVFYKHILDNILAQLAQASLEPFDVVLSDSKVCKYI